MTKGNILILAIFFTWWTLSSLMFRYTGLSNYGKYQSFQSIASKPISYGTDEANSRLFSNGHNTASTSGKNEREKRSAELNRAYDELYNKYKAQLSRKPMNGALNSSSLTSNYTPSNTHSYYEMLLKCFEFKQNILNLSTCSLFIYFSHWATVKNRCL